MTCGRKRMAHEDAHELVIVESRTPIIRAGFGNGILFMVAAFLIMFSQLAQDAGLPRVPRLAMLAVFLVCGVVVYGRCLSRLHLTEQGDLVLVRAMRTSRVSLASVKAMHVSGEPWSVFFMIAIKRKGSRLPMLFFFATPYTNWGHYEETMAGLKRLAKEVDACRLR
jgi:hypothetical protein